MKHIALRWKQATGIDIPQKLDYDVGGGVNDEVNLQRETRTIHGNGEKNRETLQEKCKRRAMLTRKSKRTPTAEEMSNDPKVRKAHIELTLLDALADIIEKM